MQTEGHKRKHSDWILLQKSETFDADPGWRNWDYIGEHLKIDYRNDTILLALLGFFWLSGVRWKNQKLLLQNFREVCEPIN